MSKLLLPSSETLPVALARLLEREIVVGILEPGTRLTEDAVLDRVDVSRAPVREAFRMLEQDGLLVRGVRRGVSVAPFSIDDLDEVYEVRVSLEGLVAGAAARRATAEDIALLEDRLAAVLGIAANAGPEDYLEANMAYSNALYQAAHNTTLVRLASGLSKQAMRYRFIAYSKLEGFTLESQDGARELLDAIKQRDHLRAAECQSVLVRSSWDQIRELLLAGSGSADSQ